MKSLSLLLLLASSFASAETHEEIVERAFDNMETRVRDHWAFTQTTSNEVGLFAATYDPRREEKWDLLTVDAREPTDEEREDFLADKNRERNRGDDDEDGGESRSMVSPGSVELIEETDAYWLFDFNPKTDSDDEAKFMRHVNGELRVEKEGHYVAYLAMKNTRPIKPGKGVKLAEFDIRMEFAPKADGSAVLPKLVRSKVKGRAMLVVRFDEEDVVEFSDYERVIE